MSAYSAAVIAARPSLYWRLGEASGPTAADSSGNGNTGTYGAACVLNQAGAMPSFDAAAKSVLCNDTNTVGVQSASFKPYVIGSSITVMGWANRAAATTTDVLFAGATADTGTLFINSGLNDVTFRSNASASANWLNAWPGSAQWVHWAVTYNDATKVAELFINGVSQGKQTLSSAFTGNSGAFFWVGLISGPGAPFNGNLQDVAVFPTIMSGAEVANIYQAGTQASPTALTLNQHAGGTPVSQHGGLSGYTEVSGHGGNTGAPLSAHSGVPGAIEVKQH